MASDHMDTRGFDADMLRQIRQLRQQGDPHPHIDVSVLDAAPDHTHRRYPVTAALCRSINDLYDDGATKAEIKRRTGLSRDAITQHVDGECDHAGEPHIDRRRCNVLRSLAHDGHTNGEIAVMVGWATPWAVRHHVSGDCTCPAGVGPVDQSRIPDQRVTPRICAWIRREARRYRDEDGPTFARVADTYDWLTDGMVLYHAHGKCTCDHAVLPIGHD